MANWITINCSIRYIIKPSDAVGSKPPHCICPIGQIISPNQKYTEGECDLMIIIIYYYSIRKFRRVRLLSILLFSLPQARDVFLHKLILLTHTDQFYKNKEPRMGNSGLVFTYANHCHG